MRSPLDLRGFPFGHPRRRPFRHGAAPFRFDARFFAADLRLPSIAIALLMIALSFTR